jgi:hypothetical protein
MADARALPTPAAFNCENPLSNSPLPPFCKPSGKRGEPCCTDAEMKVRVYLYPAVSSLSSHARKRCSCFFGELFSIFEVFRCNNGCPQSRPCQCSPSRRFTVHPFFTLLRCCHQCSGLVAGRESSARSRADTRDCACLLAASDNHHWELESPLQQLTSPSRLMCLQASPYTS